MKQRIVKTHLQLAIQAILLGAPLISAIGISPVAYASPIQQYNIAGGTLVNVLQQFAIQSKLTLAYEPHSLTEQQSTGLNGNYTVEQGLQSLLAPHGLQAIKLDNGGFSIQKIKNNQTSSNTTEIFQLKPIILTATPSNRMQQNNSDVQQLPVIIIKADEKNPTTDGTGSYTTRATTAATGLNLTLKETPQLVSVYTQQQMKDQGLTQLMDVAAIAAGLSVSASGNIGSDSSPVYSRGFSVNNYLLDGTKLLNGYSSIYQSQDTAMFDRVEIVRGASGLMTGSGTPSASINLVRKKPAQDVQANINITGGSWDYFRVDTDASSPLNEDGSIRGRVVMSAQQNNSFIDRLKEDRKVFYAVVEGDVSPQTTTSFAVSHQEINQDGSSRGGLPAWYSDGTRTNWARSDSAAAEWASSERHNTSFFADITHQFNDQWSIKSSLSRIITDSDEVIGYLGGTPDRLTGKGAVLWATRWTYRPVQDMFSTQLNGEFSLFGQDHQLVVGTTLAKSKNGKKPSLQNWPSLSNSTWDNTISNIFEWDGSNPSQPDLAVLGWGEEENINNSIFAAFRFKLSDQLALLTGARVEDWKRDTTSYRSATDVTTKTHRQETGEVTPYAGLVFDLNDYWSIYGSYTTIFTPQTTIDINGDYLDPETGNSFETGVKGAFFNNMLNIGAAVYKTKQDNKAIAVKAADGTNLMVNGQQAYEALDGTQSKGIELEITGKLAEGWQISTSFSRNITVDRDDNKLNTTVPQNTARLFTTYVLPYFNNGALQIGGGIRWQSEMYTLNSGPNKVKLSQSPVTLIDLMARYKFSENLSTNINISNLLDEKYYATAGNSYYGQPRNVRIGFSYNW
ncbi:MAG: TonB-dependent receptor [Acinetobacter populi]|jgi:outer membrane receptor for ferric coprogen and ferric-rhodotorulic acid|uniref:TonB-dependent siderophore receptor n=1 Tax=Acinetobacter populi TaxID=1582270 RepID=UPI002353F9DA|nr:TonB-dependent receptor [Acinetobacter populi]MCH4248672.1 TonB-dependent receptor [Acinetobacter populi]